MCLAGGTFRLRWCGDIRSRTSTIFEATILIIMRACCSATDDGDIEEDAGPRGV